MDFQIQKRENPIAEAEVTLTINNMAENVKKQN